MGTRGLREVSFYEEVEVQSSTLTFGPSTPNVLLPCGRLARCTKKTKAWHCVACFVLVRLCPWTVLLVESFFLCLSPTSTKSLVHGRISCGALAWLVVGPCMVRRSRLPAKPAASVALMSSCANTTGWCRQVLNSIRILFLGLSHALGCRCLLHLTAQSSFVATLRAVRQLPMPTPWSGHKHRAEYIVLKDVTHHCRRPCVLDLKMGRQVGWSSWPSHRCRAPVLSSLAVGSFLLRRLRNAFNLTCWCWPCIGRHTNPTLRRTRF